MEIIYVIQQIFSLNIPYYIQNKFFSLYFVREYVLYN